VSCSLHERVCRALIDTIQPTLLCTTVQLSIPRISTLSEPLAFHRQVRLFTYLFYGSCTAKFAVLRTPRGLGELVRRGAITSAERDALLRSSMGHNAVLEWMMTLINSALADGRLCGSASGGSPVATQISLQARLTELRASFAGIEDELTGRMPLACAHLHLRRCSRSLSSLLLASPPLPLDTQLVQIMADLLILCTPFALIHSVGGVGAVIGTGTICASGMP